MKKETVQERLQDVVKLAGGLLQAEMIVRQAGLDISRGQLYYWIKKSQLRRGLVRQKIFPIIKCLTDNLTETSRMLKELEKPLPELPQSELLSQLRELVHKYGAVTTAASYLRSQTEYHGKGGGLDVTIATWLKKEHLTEKEKAKIVRVNHVLGRPFRIEAFSPEAHEDVVMELISAAEEACSFIQHLHREPPTLLLQRIREAVENTKSLLPKRA